MNLAKEVPHVNSYGLYLPRHPGARLVLSTFKIGRDESVCLVMNSTAMSAPEFNKIPCNLMMKHGSSLEPLLFTRDTNRSRASPQILVKLLHQILPTLLQSLPGLPMNIILRPPIRPILPCRHHHLLKIRLWLPTAPPHRCIWMMHLDTHPEHLRSKPLILHRPQHRPIHKGHRHHHPKQDDWPPLPRDRPRSVRCRRHNKDEDVDTRPEEDERISQPAPGQKLEVPVLELLEGAQASAELPDAPADEEADNQVPV